MAAAEPAAPLVAVGADGARGGWAIACLYADALRRDDATVWKSGVQLQDDVSAVARFREEADGGAVVAIDVPIGLLDSVGFRPCDSAARELLRARANAVFAPPARYMLPAAGDYAAIRLLVDHERKRNPAAK